MKKHIFLNVLLFIATSLLAQPANDNCSSAQSIGTLGAPAACGNGVKSGAVTTVATTNVNSTPENPYLTLGGCGMASPANSVWYSFVAPANGYGVNIVVTATGFFPVLTNPNIALWGGNCAALVGQGCSVGAGGTATLVIAAGLVAGQTYIIQISGNTGQSGAFSLAVNAFQDCSDCLNASSMTVSPLPVNGSYNPGQAVTFCYHIDKWTNANTNWLHGVQLTFGNGWNVPTLVASPPGSACGPGNWGYYTGGITGFTQPGFYFDGNCALGPGSTDGNPANNFGDLPSGTGAAGTVINVAAGDWRFCWTLNVKVGCNPGLSLAMTVNTSGDGESGSWSDAGCAGDPATNFNAIIACCPPTIAGTSVTCNGGATGSATATPVGVAGPYTYVWSGPSAFTSTTSGVAGSNSVSGLIAGIYTVTITDKNLCAKSATISILQPPAITVTPTFTNATCVALGSISANASGGTPALTYSWSPSGGTGATASGLNAGTYTVIVRDANLCTKTATVTIISTGTVTSTFTGAGTQCLVGNAFTFVNTGSSGAGITHVYSFAPSAGAPPASPTSTVGNYGPVSFTAPGSYTVSHTVTNGVCVNTTTAAVIINPNPLATLNFTNPTCGLSNGVVFINNTSPATPPQTISTFASSLGTVSGQTVTGLAASSPVITLTNNFGCTFTISPTLTNSSGPTNVALTPNNIVCGVGTGSITIGAVTGGLATYSYAVNGGAFSTSPPVTGLAAGIYSISVKDANGCVYTKTVAITATTGPTAVTGTVTPAGCGLSNGTYNVTGVTGGTATYSFAVDAAALSTSSLTGSLASGTHTVLVKDANTCTYSTTINIIQLTGPTSATITTTNASCGSANGSATITGVTGGLAAYQYSFDGGAFAVGTTTAGLTAGGHTVIVKDANTCTLTVPYNILNTGSPTASITSSINISCFGGTNGSFTVTPAGGTGPTFTYTLTTPFQSNGTGQFSGLAAGAYNITVKDAVGCIATTSVTLTEPTQVAITATASPAKCFGAATGSIAVAGTGGTPTYSYNLNGGAYQASSNFTSQFSGIYTIGIKDANGCMATQSIQVTQPTALVIQVASQNANCTAANGIGTTTVTGGAPIYTYTWTGGGGAAATSNGIVSGNYTVTATDGNGCVITSPVVIGLTPGGTAAITASTNITCNGANNGSMTAGMIGGSSPFTYSWTPGGQTVATAINLSPGTYTCTITDFYGCKASIAGTITQPPVLTAIMNSNNVKCFGTSTGTISAAGSGGTGTYTYLWSTIPSTLSTVNNVAIGNYPCTITDANGCAITQSIAVTQPTTITLTPTVTSANCNQANGSGTVTASGGAPGAYTYTWSSGSNTNTQGSVLAGTYTIIVQDANNCLQTLAVTIPNTAGPVISITSQTNVSCFGGNNGAATTSVTGGVGTYTYSWSNGITSSIATNLLSSIYTVSVTDQAGCVASTSVNITQPTPLTVGILPTDPKCFGATNGFGIAAASGGTPSYTYAWTSAGGGSATSNQLGAGNYGLTVTDGNGCVITSSMALVNPPAMAASITSTNVTCFGTCNGTAIATSTNGIGVISYFWTGGTSPIAAQTASGLCAGSYTVLATDQNSCTASAQVTITQPTQVTANITSTGSITCNGGNNGFAVVTPAGGTGAYSYTWSPSGGNSSTASTLTAGVYVVTVQDANSCSATATATIIQPTPLATTLTTTNVKCNGACDGSANVAFSGGAGTTTFLWQPGLQSGNFVNNLCVGGQTVTITSNAACPTILTFTLTEPAQLTAVASATNSNCGQNNGRVCATVGGGTAPLSYQWSNGPITLCNNNIVAGAYSFTVTDGNSCKAVASGLVNDIAGPVVSITGQTNISCFGGNNGAVTTTITGGVPNYVISWTDGQTTQNVTNFTSGIKNITVVDAAGCVGTASVEITQPTQFLSAIGSFTNVTCYGLSNGGSTLLVTGGTTPYSYTWTPSAQTSSVMIGVTANTYTGNVSDANGCLTSQTVTISEPQPLVMTASSFTNVSCFGGNNGQISTTFQGGTFPYSYSWTPSGSGGVLTGLVAGGYSLSLVDANNCPKNANFTITEPSVLTSTYTSLPATCGLTNGSATVTIGGGTPVYSLVWNLPGTPTGTVATNMAPGNNWIANITDSKGCTITQTVSVANPPIPVFTTYGTTSPSCFGLSNGDITLNYSAGTAPYTIVWSSPISQTITTSALTQSVAGVAAGLYTAILTDGYGCTTSQPVNVTQPGLLVLLVNPNPSICFGETTQLNASGQNGTPAYSYTWSPSPFVGGGPHTVSPNVTTTYTVAISDANGCSPTPKIITVNVTPQLSAIGSSVTLCHGAMTVLTPTITSPGNGGAYTYTWNPIAGNSNSNTVFGSASTIATTNTFAVTISDGCTIPNASAIFTVNVNPLPVIDFAGPFQGCAPLMVTLTGTSDGVADMFTWTDNKNGNLGSGNPLPVLFADSGKYSITLNVVNTTTGCSNTLTKANYVEVFPQPIAAFYAEPLKASILDPNIDFINTSQGAISYYWNFGDPAAINSGNNSMITNPSHGYTYVGEYVVNLVATSPKGCKDTTQLIVEITPDFALYIPNTFTPDGNGLNDIFQPMGVGIDEENYRMDIFDRWGENIFTSNNFRKGWDGTVKGNSKIAEQGVYTYKILVRDIMGNKHPMVGHVTVIRQN